MQREDTGQTINFLLLSIAVNHNNHFEVYSSKPVAGHVHSAASTLRRKALEAHFKLEIICRLKITVHTVVVLAQNTNSFEIETCACIVFWLQNFTGRRNREIGRKQTDAQTTHLADTHTVSHPHTSSRSPTAAHIHPHSTGDRRKYSEHETQIVAIVYFAFGIQLISMV